MRQQRSSSRLYRANKGRHKARKKEKVPGVDNVTEERLCYRLHYRQADTSLQRMMAAMRSTHARDTVSVHNFSKETSARTTELSAQRSS